MPRATELKYYRNIGIMAHIDKIAHQHVIQFWDMHIMVQQLQKIYNRNIL